MQLKLSLTAAVLFENAQAAIFRILEFRTEHQLMLKLVQEQQLGTTAVQEVLVRVEEEILTYIKTKSKLRFLKEIKPCNPELTAFYYLKCTLHSSMIGKNGMSRFQKKKLLN